MVGPRAPKIFIVLINLAWTMGWVHYKIVKNGNHDKKKGPSRKGINPAKCEVLRQTKISQNAPVRETPWRILKCNGRTRRYWIFTCMLVYDTYPLYLLFRVFQIYVKDQEPNNQKLIQTFYMFLCISLGVSSQIQYLIRWKENPCVLEAIFLLFNKETLSEEKYVVPKNGRPIPHKEEIRSSLAAVICCAIAVYATLQSLISILNGSNRVFFYSSLLNNPELAPPGLRMLITAVHAFYYGNLWIFTLINIFVYLAGYLACVVIKFKNLKAAGFSKDDGIDITVRRLQVLHATWLHIFQHFLLPAFSVTYHLCGTLAIYGVVRFPRKGALKATLMLWYLISQLYIVYRLSAQLNDSSKHFLRQWMESVRLGNLSRRKGKYTQRFVWSIRGFRVYVGNAFYLENNTIAKMLGDVVNNAVTLILL